MTPRTTTGIEGSEAPPRGIFPYDVRLRREITHRRLVVAMLRRFVRIVTLHLVDGGLIATVVWSLGLMNPSYVAARQYIPAIVVIFLGGLNALSSYSPGDARRDRRRLLSGVCLGVVILACLVVTPPSLPFSTSFLVTLALAAFTFLAAGRYVVDQIVRQAYKRGIGLRSAVIVGNLEEVGRAILQLREERNIDQYLVGHITPDAEPDPASLGRLSEAARILDDLDIQEVIVTASLSTREVHAVSYLCFEKGAALYVAPSVVAASELRTEVMRVGACTLVRLHPARLQLPALLVKRGFDITIAALLLVLLSPVMLVIAIAIKLNSRGPVFFRSRRVGLGGRPFYMWKFRSMFRDAIGRERELAHLNIYPNGTFKIANDPRVTRVGRFLRRTSLDELPQLFNVIVGEMSLVGPRPSLEGDVDRFQSHHFERLSVIPGMTGPWQVSGRNLITDFDQIVKLERAYIRSWSLLLDAKILLRTLKVVVRGDGAY
ncbi:MAG: exopolysaccharide biosynthesis polyprenyl glycosylphosphotransferase [Gemmatimonas sp.]|nr:exopolysaccharide biosynthesis polyprenyl glycosylphosphotransferase [Gemmatimonas sp.]